VKVIEGLTVNETYHKGLRFFRDAINSRNGEVRYVPTRQGGFVWEAVQPVTTVYRRPVLRVLFDPTRDANPFFHLMEAMWVLSGRDDVGFLSHYVKTIRQFSDDGETFAGSYGARLRPHLSEAIMMLREYPESRRVFLPIYTPEDVGAESRDIPCNTGAAVSVRDGSLNLTVFNRSNDMIWGAYGANAVQFAFLLEYLAAAIGVWPGAYHQVSNSFHVYPEVFNKALGNGLDYAEPANLDPYQSHYAAERFPIIRARAGTATYFPIGGFMDREAGKPVPGFDFFQEDLDKMRHVPAADLGRLDWGSLFFTHVIAPMSRAWELHRARDYLGARETVQNEVLAVDWAAAADAWLERRHQKYEAKED
jgi:hypothetical protein